MLKRSAKTKPSKPAAKRAAKSSRAAVPATRPKVAKAAKKVPGLDHQRRQLLDAKTLPELKALLKRNDQITTGTKTKLIKRIVDCIKHGALPRCPSCGLGRLKVGTWWDVTDDGEASQHKGFKCPGGYDDDEYVYCGFTASVGELERPPWQFETPGGLV